MATEKGIVTKIGDDTAWVKTTQSGACESCSQRQACHAQGGEMEVQVLNDIGAKVGDRIVLSFENAPLLKATFLLYIFPILMMLVGAVVGNELASVAAMDVSAASALSAFLFLAGAVLFIKFKGNQLAERKDYRPRIIRILNRKR